MTETSENSPRSTFVTVVAWIFIVLAGFTTAIGILQNIMINTVFPLDQMQHGLAQAKGHPPMPAFFAFMFENIRAIFLAVLILSATTFVSSIGLLRRKNLARVVFICLMVFGIAWNVFSIAIQQYMLSSMPEFQVNVPADVRAQADLFSKGILIFSFIMAAGFSILFGWIIKRLLSPSIKGEFT